MRVFSGIGGVDGLEELVAGEAIDVITRFKEGYFGPGLCTFGAVSHLDAQCLSFTCVTTKAEGLLILLVSNNLG